MKVLTSQLNQYAAQADLPFWYTFPYGLRRGIELFFKIFVIAVTAWALDESPAFLHASWQLATLSYGTFGRVGPFVHTAAWLLMRVVGCALICLALAVVNLIAVVVETAFSGKQLLGNERLSKAFRSFERQQIASYAFLAVVFFFALLVKWR